MLAQIAALPSKDKGLSATVARLAIGGKKWIEERLGRPMHDPQGGNVPALRLPSAAVGRRQLPKVRHMADSGSWTQPVFTSITELETHLRSLAPTLGTHSAYRKMLKEVKTNVEGIATDLMQKSRAEVTRYVTDEILAKVAIKTGELEEARDKLLEKQKRYNKMKQNESAKYKKLAPATKRKMTVALNREIRDINEKIAAAKSSVEQLTEEFDDIDYEDGGVKRVNTLDKMIEEYEKAEEAE